MALETRNPNEFKNTNIFQVSLVKARVGWQNLTTKEYLAIGDFGLVGGINIKDGRVDWDSIPYVNEWRYEQDRYIQLKRNDVLISKDGTIGKVALVDELPLPATLNSGVFVVRPPKELCDPKFLFYVLTSTIFEDFISKLSAGSTISHLYQKDLGQFSVDIPSDLNEQKAIAEALSDIDELIVNSKVLLDKKQKFLDGLLLKVFSGNIEFGDKRVDWKTTSFKEVSVIDWGNTNLTKRAYVDGGKYLAVSATGIDGHIDHYEHEAFVPVISAIGALCGKMLLPRDRFAAIKNTITVTPKKGVSEGRFLFYLLRFSELPIRGGAQPFISKGDIERFEALMPFGGELEYQQQVLIADFLDTFEQEISDLKSELKKYEWLKQGMMNDLLSGKVRLV